MAMAIATCSRGPRGNWQQAHSRRAQRAGQILRSGTSKSLQNQGDCAWGWGESARGTYHYLYPPPLGIQRSRRAKRAGKILRSGTPKLLQNQGNRTRCQVFGRAGINCSAWDMLLPAAASWADELLIATALKVAACCRVPAARINYYFLVAATRFPNGL